MTAAVLKYNEYEVSAVDFEEPKFTSKKNQLQSIQFPTYKGGRSPLIQLPKIEIDMYGIPSKSDYYKDDFQRMFIKLPLNQEVQEVKWLTEKFLSKIDDKFNSPEMKEKVFGKKKVKHAYQPLVRIPLTEDGKANTEKHPYMKIKLSTKYPTNDIQTSVVLQHPGGDREAISDTRFIDDFQYYVRFHAKVKCIIAPSKLWYHPSTVADPMFGITFKLVKVLVEMPPLKMGMDKFLKDETAFIDSEDESDSD